MGRAVSIRLSLASLGIALALSSCSTATSRWEATLQDKGICDGSKARRTIGYEMEYALATPPGLTIDQAGKYAEGAEVLRRFIRDQLFLILAQVKVEPADGNIPGTATYRQVGSGQRASSPIRNYVDLSKAEDAEYYRIPKLEVHLRDFGDGSNLKLMACTEENCRRLGLKKNDGLVLVEHAYNLADSGQVHHALAFVKKTGIDLGRFLADYYLLVPAIQRSSLCRQVGLPETCLEKNLGNQLCSGTQYYDLTNRNPTTIAIQKQRPLFCGVIDANYQLGEPWRGAHGPLESKRESESWTAFQLLFALGLKTSAKSEPGVTKDLVTWTPELLCRYARPRQELRTP